MAKDSIFYPLKSLKKGKELFCLDQAVVMGILNCSPDSFYSESRVNPETILRKAEQMILEGAQILDIGGYSTRPGAAEISIDEELNRVIPAIQQIRANFPDITISIDTFRAKVAKESLEAGAHWINDIGGGSLDNEMFNVVSETDSPYILCHIQGNPSTMQLNPQYKDVTEEIIYWFSQQIKELHSRGIHDIIVDPGIGFGKSAEHNFKLLAQLERFQQLEKPILIGISRKSFIYKTLGLTPETSLAATSALHLHCLEKGASILRVHDVKDAIEMIKIYAELSA